jgi:hypothetical protein
VFDEKPSSSRLSPDVFDHFFVIDLVRHSEKEFSHSDSDLVTHLGSKLVVLRDATAERSGLG